MRRVKILKDFTWETSALFAGELVLVLRDEIDLSEKEVEEMARLGDIVSPERAKELFPNEPEMWKEYLISNEEVDPWELEFEEVETIFQKLGLPVSERFINIFIENTRRRVTSTPQFDEFGAEEGRKIVWFDADLTQGVQFIYELDTPPFRPQFRRLVWILEAWARHALTNYDQEIRRTREPTELRKTKTAEGVRELLKDQALREDYTLLLRKAMEQNPEDWEIEEKIKFFKLEDEVFRN